jgi:hypothetical protein
MNDPLTGLGNSLYKDYDQQMKAWSQLDFTFNAQDLPASPRMADDMLSLEEDWQTLGELVPTRHTDYVPQDLVPVSNPIPLRPEEPAGPANSVNRVDRFPFKFPNESQLIEFYPDFSTQMQMSAPKDKTPVRKSNPALGSTADTSETETSSATHTQNQNLSAEFAETTFQGPVTNISGAPAINTTETIPSLPDPPVKRKEARMEQLIAPMQEDEPKTHRHHHYSDNSSDSMWIEPLQNLNDFAARIGPPSMENTIRSQQLIPGLVPITAKDPIPAENVQLENFPVKLLLSGGTVSGGFETSDVLSNDDNSARPGPTGSFKAETQVFEQQTPQYIPDTDDLLEALTDRIRREFRRYYP